MDLVFESPGYPLFADGLRLAALPAEGVADGLSSGTVPDYGGLPLVGDSDCGYVVEAEAALEESALDGLEDCVPDLVGVVLDPAALGAVLGGFFLVGGDYRRLLVENDGPGTGGSLIDGQDVVLHIGCCFFIRKRAWDGQSRAGAERARAL